MIHFLKCLTFFGLISITSCLDTAGFLIEATDLIVCNEEHLLTPAVEKDFGYSIYVRNFLSEPLVGLELSISCTRSTCDGKNFLVYAKDIKTNELGFVNDGIPLNYTWDNDVINIEIAVIGNGYNYIAYKERFGYEKDFLTTILTVSALDD